MLLHYVVAAVVLAGLLVGWRLLTRRSRSKWIGLGLDEDIRSERRP